MRYTANCADCGVDGLAPGGEWYMVYDEVWQRAWPGSRGKIYSQEFLCIGCLEKRIGRTLTAFDFTDAPVNDPNDPYIPARLRDRLTATQGVFKFGS